MLQVKKSRICALGCFRKSTNPGGFSEAEKSGRNALV